MSIGSKFQSIKQDNVSNLKRPGIKRYSDIDFEKKKVRNKTPPTYHSCVKLPMQELFDSSEESEDMNSDSMDGEQDFDKSDNEEAMFKSLSPRVCA